MIHDRNEPTGRPTGRKAPAKDPRPPAVRPSYEPAARKPVRVQGVAADLRCRCGGEALAGEGTVARCQGCGARYVVRLVPVEVAGETVDFADRRRRVRGLLR